MPSPINNKFCAFYSDDPMLDIVGFRAQTTSKQITDYLAELGHKEIAYIGSKHSLGDSVVRYLGYQESLIRHQIRLRPELVVETNMTPAEIKSGMQYLMTLQRPPSAIFASSDVAVLAVVDYCFEHGIALPEQLSLATFDNRAILQRKLLCITSMVVPMEDVGQKAIEVFLNRIRNPKLPPQYHQFFCRLEVRQTTAPPR